MSAGGNRGTGTSALVPGSMLDGKYEVVGLLGAGGMGEVYKVRHVHLGAYRCVKIMKPGLLADEMSRGRFLREARLATQIHHPNVAVVHDFSILEDGTSFMVTEFIDGTTVRQWSAKHGRFPLALAADVATQVLAGLDHIHRRGLLHRDISADNIMLQYDTDEHLIVKIIDLGVAKDVSGGLDTTHSGLIVGNPKYMSPEQLGELEEGEQIDGRADLYSLGVVLYEMLLGVPPFQARTPNQYIVKHLTQPPPTFHESRPELEFPGGLEAVIFKTLEKDRRNRFPDARSFAYALTPFVARAAGTFTRAEVMKFQPSFEETIAENVPEVRSDVAWMRAVAADSYVAFRDFLAQYPISAYSYEAQRAIAERLAFDGAAAIDTEDAWLDYLERWGSDRHASAAKQRLEAARGREETAWAAASDMKTASAWHAYLEEFPDGNRSARAETNRREALAFEQARTSGRAALEQFLRGYPDGLLAKDAKRLIRQRADDDDFEHARSLDTVAAWTLYLQTYPNGSHRDVARERQRAASEKEEADALKSALDAIARGDGEAAVPLLSKIRTPARRSEVEAAIENWRDQRSWDETKRNGSLPAMQAYLHARPEGRHAAEARATLASLGVQDADWDAAWEAGTSAAWDVYLERHPRSLRLDEAQRCRREAAEFEMAESLDTPAMWRAFVKAWPDGRHRLDAEVRARKK